MENKYSLSIFFEKKLFQINWNTNAGVHRKKNVFSANDSCLSAFFPLPLRGEGKALGTSPRRYSHHWPLLVYIFGLKGEEAKRTQGEQPLVTTTHPTSAHNGEPDASCFHVFKYKTCVLHIHRQCSRASQGIGHFWRQYFKNKNLCWLCILAVCHFFFHVPLLYYLELPVACEADFISWMNMTKKCTFSFTHLVNE